MADKSKKRKTILGILIVVMVVFFFTFGESFLDGLIDGFNSAPAK